MKNTLLDLNDHFFILMEKITDDDVNGDELLEVASRVRSLSEMAVHVIHISEVLLRSSLSIANSIAEVQTPPPLEYRHKNRKMLAIE